MNIFKNLPIEILRDVYAMDDTYKIKFTNDVIKTKIIEEAHLKKMCKDGKAQIVHKLFFIYNYDYEVDTYYGFKSLIGDNGIDVENMFDVFEMTFHLDFIPPYAAFQKFTMDEKRYYQNYDYSNFENKNKI